MKKVVINERKEKNDFTDVLEIWHIDTPEVELTKTEAIAAAEEWCEENGFFSEGYIFQVENSDVWEMRVCPNEYK